MSSTSFDEVAAPAGRGAALWLKLKGLVGAGGDNAAMKRMAGAAFIIRVANAGIAFASQILLARWMGAHEFGIYVYVWTWVLLVGGIVDLGLASAAQRFVPQFTETKEFDRLRGFLVGSRVLSLVIAVVFGLGAGGLVFALQPMIGEGLALALLIALACLPLYAMTNVQEGIARSYDWTGLALLPGYFVRPLLILAVMAAAHVAGFEATGVNAMWAVLVATTLAALGQLVLLQRKLAATVPAGPRTHTPKAWLAVSLPILLVEGFYLLLTYTDVLVLKLYVDASSVAVYFAATKVLALVAFVYWAIAAAVGHRFAEAHVQGDQARLKTLLRQSIHLTFWPSLAGIVFLLAVGEHILALFGPEFVAGWPVMAVLAVGLMARAAVGPIERLLNMLGQEKVCAAIYAGAFFANLALNFLLIPQFGILGAAIATAAALTGESVLLYLVTRKRLGLHGFVFGGRA